MQSRIIYPTLIGDSARYRVQYINLYGARGGDARRHSRPYRCTNRKTDDRAESIRAAAKSRLLYVRTYVRRVDAVDATRRDVTRGGVPKILYVTRPRVTQISEITFLESQRS